MESGGIRVHCNRFSAARKAKRTGDCPVGARCCQPAGPVVLVGVAAADSTDGNLVLVRGGAQYKSVVCKRTLQPHLHVVAHLHISGQERSSRPRPLLQPQRPIGRVDGGGD